MNSFSKGKPSLRVWVKPSATFPPFAQPTVVGYFSLDQDRRFTPNTAQLRYMHLPRVAEDLGWNLSHGLDKVQRSDHAKSIERIDNLLRGLLASGLTICPEVASFMCLRGLLTRIMTTPYEQNQGWEILVSKFRGVLFMCAQETSEQRRERMGKDDAQKRFCSWGFKFEQYMTTDQPGCPPDTDMPVKEGEEFCCLFRTKLNDRRLLYGAEMDAVTSDVPLEDCLEDLMCAEFIELKTSRKLTCVRQERNFKRFKLLNWWAQNFLVNVAHIICGFRDDHGVIDNIAFYKVEEIPKMARDLWVPAVCMTFLDQFLSFVGKTVWDCPQSDDPNTVWRFRWEPGVHFVTGDMIPGRSQFSFLPDWFLSSVMAMNNHPLDFRIPIYSIRRGKNSNSDDEKTHTAKILTLAKDIALHRSKRKRPPSPRTLMIAQRNNKPPLKETSSSTAQSVNSEPSSSSSSIQKSTPSAVIVIVSPTTEPDPNVSPVATTNPQVCIDFPSSGSNSSNVPEIQGTHSKGVSSPSRPRSQPRTNRRRGREDRLPQSYSTSSSKRGMDESDNASFHPSNQPKNSHPPRPKVVKHADDTSDVVTSYDNASSNTSVCSDILRANSIEQSSFSSDEFPSTSNVEEVVYASLQPLESDAYLVSHSSAELSPSTSMDQYTSQAFLSSSLPEDAYPQHQLLSSSLTSPSLIADSYSSHTFSDCDDMPPTTYVVSSSSEFMHQESYLQSAIPLGQASQRSYLSSPTSSEYVSQSTFLPGDGIHSSEMYVSETQEDLTSSHLLPSVASVSQTFMHSSSDISSDDIQTAEGSLSTINRLSSSAYLPPPSSAEHLTLQM